MLSLGGVCGQALEGLGGLHGRIPVHPLPTEKLQAGSAPGPLEHPSLRRPATRAHGTGQENENRARFLGKLTHPSGSAGGNPGGVTRGFFFLLQPYHPPGGTLL